MKNWQRVRYWLATHTRAIFWWLYLIGLGVGLFLLFGCATAPIQRSTDTPAYELRQGQSVILQIKDRQEIAEYARKHTDAAYRADAVAMWRENICTVWMPDGPVNLYLLNHELAHCAGLRHNRFGKWEN